MSKSDPYAPPDEDEEAPSEAPVGSPAAEKPSAGTGTPSGDEKPSGAKRTAKKAPAKKSVAKKP